MVEKDLRQWMADNDRLVIAGLSNVGSGPPDYDEETLIAVKQRCINRYGERIGTIYYRGLIATLPDRRPNLFPELVNTDK